MRDAEPLVWYGITVFVVITGFIVISCWRCKAPILSAWNSLLVGIAVFIGLGAIEAATTHVGDVFPELSWFRPTRNEVNWYILSSTVFIVAVFIGRYMNPVGRRLAASSLQKWPPLTFSLVLFVLAVCLLVSLADPFTRQMVFWGPTINNLTRKAWVAASAFTFVYWYTHRNNVLALGLFLFVFTLAALESMVMSAGRRMLLTVTLAPIVTVYWLTMRNWAVKRSFLIMSLAGAMLFGVGATYSTFRWFRASESSGGRSIGAVTKQVSQVSFQNVVDTVSGGSLRFLAQSNGHYALLLKRVLDEGRVESEPANTLLFLLSYPVPHRIWPGKPIPVGNRMTQILQMPHSTPFSVGISGHGAFEGGILILILYGFLIGTGTMFFDQPMLLQPSNPFLISILSAAIPHIIALPRGDLGIMAIETIICFVFVIPLGIFGRFIFGTNPTFRANYPGHASFPPVRYVAR